MNYIDIIIAIILVFGMIQGLRHGLVKELASFIAVIIGIYVARYFSEPVARQLVEWTEWSQQICLTLAYALLFTGVALAIHTLSYVISKLLSAIMLGWINRLLGAIFSVVKWVLIISVILNILSFVDNLFPIKKQPTVQESKLYAPLESVIWRIMPHFDDFNLKQEIEKASFETYII